MDITDFCNKKKNAEKKIKNIINALQDESGVVIRSCSFYTASVHDENGNHMISKCADVHLEVTL